MRLFVLCIMLVSNFIRSPIAFGQDITLDEDKAKRQVVFISGLFEDNSPTAGTGVIVGADSDSLYIITANHVVRSRNRNLSRLDVEFNFVRGKILARLLEDHDTGLDLAVLAVGRNQIGNADALLDYRILGNSLNLKVGDALYSVLDPNEGKWVSNVNPYLFRELDGNILKFEQTGLTEGYSGGGLFDDAYRLVGIIIQWPPGAIAQATTIEAAQRRLEVWRVPTNLVLAPEISKRKPLWPWLTGGGVAAAGGFLYVLLRDTDDPEDMEVDDFAPLPSVP